MKIKSNKGKTSRSSQTESSISSRTPEAVSDPSDIDCGSLGPLARMEHGLNIERMTPESFRAAQQFIHACQKVGVWRLKQGELTDDAGFYIGDLARNLAETVRILIEKGDLMLARRLPPIAESLQNTLSLYGSKISAHVEKRLPIEQILRKKKARELLAMVSALHPDWDSFLHIPDRQAIEALPEKRLRELLLSKECWVQRRDGRRSEEWRKHRLAEIIENIIAVREGENENINLFVEHLHRGQLWSGPKQTFVKCDWHGKKDLPPRDDVRGWMKIVMPFLRRATDNDAMKLAVFQHMLAARKHVFAGERLADDKPEYVWNQVENRIRNAWITMATRARKRNSGKSA